MPPFHFAFFVKDLASTRRFYGDVLGCREGRSTDTWVDFDFFGSQTAVSASLCTLLRYMSSKVRSPNWTVALS